MKKTIIFTLVALFATMFFGCNNDEGLPRQAADNGNARSAVGSRFRTLDEAIDIVNDAMSMLDDGTQIKTRASRSISMANTRVITSPITRSGETDTLLYILNFDNEAGYAVVSANRETEGLLAIADQGNYSGEGSVNPGAQMFIDRAMVYATVPKRPQPTDPDSLKIDEGGNGNGNGNGGGNTGGGNNGGNEGGDNGGTGTVPGFATHFYETTVDTVMNILPRVKLRLGEVYPEGNYCDNKRSGCAVTAAVMIMSYFKNPKSHIINYPGCDVDKIQLDWDDINKHVGLSYMCTNKCGTSHDGHVALAHLCRQLGYQADAIYQMTPTRKTYIDQANFKKIFSKTNLSTSGIKKYDEKAINNLKLNSILYVYGSYKDERDSIADGHVWIIDGGVILKQTDRLYVQYAGQPKIFDSEVVTEKKYMHVNWGVNGDSNGYYSNSVFNTDNILKLDENAYPGLGYKANYNINYMTVNYYSLNI